MTDKDVNRYLDLIDRRLFILTHSGVDWKPEYGPEMVSIEQELAGLRVVVNTEHKKSKERIE